MSQRHWIQVKRGDSIVYHRQILGNNIFADKEFYKNLNLNIDWGDMILKETEINLKTFMLEWWKYITRTFDVKFLEEDYEMFFEGDMDDDTLYSQLVFQNRSVLNQYFLVLENLVAYTQAFDNTKLDEQYKLYISVY